MLAGLARPLSRGVQPLVAQCRGRRETAQAQQGVSRLQARRALRTSAVTQWSRRRTRRRDTLGVPAGWHDNDCVASFHVPMPPQPTANHAAAPAEAADTKAQQHDAERKGWFGGAVRALFVREARVRRVDGKLAVALHDKAGQPSPMRAELKALLNAAPDSRSRLRFLAAVEHGLKHKDPTGLFLYEVEPERLRAALRQFDALVPEQPSPTLAALRARLVDAIGSREKKRKRLEMLAPRSDLMRDQRIEVTEARASDFARIQAQWKTESSAT